MLGLVPWGDAEVECKPGGGHVPRRDDATLSGSSGVPPPRDTTAADSCHRLDLRAPDTELRPCLVSKGTIGSLGRGTTGARGPRPPPGDRDRRFPGIADPVRRTRVRGMRPGAEHGSISKPSRRQPMAPGQISAGGAPCPRPKEAADPAPFPVLRADGFPIAHRLRLPLPSQQEGPEADGLAAAIMASSATKRAATSLPKHSIPVHPAAHELDPRHFSICREVLCIPTANNSQPDCPEHPGPFRDRLEARPPRITGFRSPDFWSRKRSSVSEARGGNSAEDFFGSREPARIGLSGHHIATNESIFIARAPAVPGSSGTGAGWHPTGASPPSHSRPDRRE